MKHSEVYVKVSNMIYTFNSPTRLGVFLETMNPQQKYELNDRGYSWAQQVQTNLKNGYSYLENAECS